MSHRRRTFSKACNSFTESDFECQYVDDHFKDTGNCDPNCVFGSGHNKPAVKLDIFECSKCKDVTVCSICVAKGGHRPHGKYLKLCNRP